MSIILARLGAIEVKQAEFAAHEEWAEERIKKHNKDLYEGNGLPSITNRLSAVEMIAGMAKWLTVTAVINTIALVVFLIRFWISKGGH